MLNELAASTDAGGVNLLVGKSVVSWDVGYAFRPNDMVQQEARRELIAKPLEGRPMVMAQSFKEGQAWSALVFKQVRRTQDNNAAGKDEYAMAARYFVQFGSADLYAFGKYGEDSRASIGAAASWVASDQLEVHGSYRRTGLQPLPTLAGGVPAIASSDPYGLGPEAHRNQVLVGLTWTTSEKVSLLAEAWYDGGAPPDSFWHAWRSRGDGIWALARGPNSPLVSANAAAGNLGWQASQLSGYGLRRENVFVRLSWTRDEWQPALDVLFTPRDGGLVATAGATWQGDRVRVDAGVRYYGGRNGSLYWQTPRRAVLYGGVAVPF
ncbi:hypothetical protein [Ottowia sp.]|uniref:hypothetical protein n=1 Tax=Ottowia sp. TaxID=1898956 RepID=UPI0025FEFDE8|nr:hypothetical protein [Ottowia sp.]MBK6616493.1 hypothetical protein [Ottowia sp.]